MKRNFVDVVSLVGRRAQAPPSPPRDDRYSLCIGRLVEPQLLSRENPVRSAPGRSILSIPESFQPLRAALGVEFPGYSLLPDGLLIAPFPDVFIPRANFQREISTFRGIALLSRDRFIPECRPIEWKRYVFEF